MQKKSLLGTVLFVYILAVTAAFANPMKLPQYQVSLSIQSATMATLALITPLLGEHANAATTLLAGLGLSLSARLLHTAFMVKDPKDQSTGIVSRWDAFVTNLGLLATVGLVAYKEAGGIVALCMVYVGLPLIFSVPHTITSGLVEHRELIDTALTVAANAYRVNGENGDYVNDPVTGTLAGVTVRGQDTYVFFSGTDSRTDMVRVNADFHMDELPEAWITDCLSTSPKVHRGFLKAYMTVRSKLWGKILENVLRVGGSGRIVCCGHSLGGALATLACLDLSCRLDPEDAAKLCCVTFGSPQVGDGLFVDAFNQRIPLSLRAVTTYDPIPKTLSAQLPHVKGLVPLASTPQWTSHDITAYRWAIQQKPWQNMLMTLAPMIFLILITMVVTKISRTS
jgi:hypothetical protein